MPSRNDISLNKDIRYSLFLQYAEELEEICGHALSDIDERELWFSEILDRGDWVDLYDEGKICGFLVIYKELNPQIHDYFICQAYVVPKSRKKGLMSEALLNYTNGNPGSYGLIVLDKNQYAKTFWNELFVEKLGKELSRRAEYPELNLEPDEILYVFK